MSARRPDRSGQGEAYQRAQAGVTLSLQRLQEAYPELKSQGNYTTLMSQLEGTENRIAIARRDYNSAVQAYNTRDPHLPRRDRRQDLLRRQADGAVPGDDAGRGDRADGQLRQRELTRRALECRVDAHACDVALVAGAAAVRGAAPAPRRPSRSSPGCVVDAANVLPPDDRGGADRQARRAAEGHAPPAGRRDDPRSAGLSDRGLWLSARPGLGRRAEGRQQRRRSCSSRPTSQRKVRGSRSATGWSRS